MINKKKAKTIVDIEKEITCNDPIDIRPGDALLDEDDYGEIAKSFEIISKYKVGDWYSTTSVTELQTDIIVLQSINAFLTTKTAVLVSYTQNLEDQLKVARAKIRVNAKSIKCDFEDNGDIVKITAEDIKDLSYAKTEDLFRKLENIRQASDFVRYIHFAIKEQIKYLDLALARLHYRGE